MPEPIYPVTAGHPVYTGTFIPEIWSGKLIESFYNATVLAAISNTSYEGEIKNHGDKVKIRSIPEVQIRNYVKGQILEVDEPEAPCLLYTSPSPRDRQKSRMPSSA